MTTTIRPAKTAADFYEGQRVIGLGRNGYFWPMRPAGTVTKIWRTGYVRVTWDGTRESFDDMLPAELEIPPTIAQGSGQRADVRA